MAGLIRPVAPAPGRPKPNARVRVGPPKRKVIHGQEFTVTLSDWYRDRMNGDSPIDRVASCKDLCSILSALGFDLPREAYLPGPDQHSFKAQKWLKIPAVPGNQEVLPDCEIPFNALGKCWLFIEKVEITPANLTAAESVIVLPTIHCGLEEIVIDFCGVVGEAHVNPGQFTKPQRFLVPPGGTFILTPYNLDGYSGAIINVEVGGWLVPPAIEREKPTSGVSGAKHSAGANHVANPGARR